MATRCVYAIAAAVVMSALSGCAERADLNNVVPSTPTSTVSAVPFTLLTHCGIHEVRVEDTFYVADQPLDDGNGNPPTGWGNPVQQGTMTVKGGTAVFRDDIGHTVAFHERPGATSFLRTCS